MSDIIKAAQADASQVQNDATNAADAALARASKLAGTVGADASRYANQATIGMQKDVTQAQGWLRRNVWGVLGAAVVLALIVFWFVVR